MGSERNWKSKLIEMDIQPIEALDESYKKSYDTKKDDIGFVHPVTGAGLLIRENRRIESFADFGLGFRMDPETQSFSIFAPTVKFFANEVKTFNHEEYKTYLRDEYGEIINLLKGEEINNG